VVISLLIVGERSPVLKLYIHELVLYCVALTTVRLRVVTSFVMITHDIYS